MNGTPSVPDRDNGWRARLNHWRHHRPDGWTAFVLSGGGSRGAAQVGMLAELVDRGIRADRVYGASVGAINGSAYCGDPTPAGMKKLEDTWLNLTGELVFPRGRAHGPWTFVQHRPSVHSNSGLRRIVADGIAFDRLEEAHIPLEVVAASLNDGQERWLDRGPAVEAVLASAAIPSLLPPVSIDGETLIDGGVVNNVPIMRPIAAGATRLYVLLCGPVHYTPPVPERPLEAMLNALFLAVHSRLTRELPLVPPGVEVVMFSIGEPRIADYRDFSGSSELIALGRSAVARVLDRADLPVGPTAG
ncbi:MAG: patatin-like phospholipase family protein [Acidimicrobiales bacterium]